MIFLFSFPVLLISVGIVWKDVLFAHAALLGLLLLPGGQSRHWSTLAFAAAAWRWAPLFANKEWPSPS